MFNFILKLMDALIWPLVFALAVWLVFFIDLAYGLDLASYGMHPRSWRGIPGIITMPFLHGDFDHLFSNTVPLVLSMGFIFLYFERIKYRIIIYSWLTTGLLTLLIAEPGTTHIGASGLVYAFIFFLVAHAFMTRNKEMLAASFVLIFLYGGLLYGLFPEYGFLIGKNISWEGHLSGAISGVTFAFIYRKQGPQKKIYFEDEDDDDDDPDQFPYWNIDEHYRHTVHYHYKKREE